MISLGRDEKQKRKNNGSEKKKIKAHVRSNGQTGTRQSKTMAHDPTRFTSKLTGSGTQPATFKKISKVHGKFEAGQRIEYYWSGNFEYP